MANSTVKTVPSRHEFTKKKLRQNNDVKTWRANCATFVIGDGNLVLAAGTLVHGRHVQNAVGVQIERHLDLRHATRSWWDSAQFKLAEKIVVLGHGTLALVHLASSTITHTI